MIVLRSRYVMRSMLPIKFPSSKSRAAKTAFSSEMYIVSNVRMRSR